MRECLARKASRARGRCSLVLSALLVLGFAFPGNAGCREMSDAEMLREIQELKARLEYLEEQLRKRGKGDEGTERGSPRTGPPEDQVSGQVPGQTPIEPSEKEAELPWEERITLSGLVELEAVSERRRMRSSSAEGRATKVRVDEGPFLSVELAADLRANEYLSGRIVLSYEEDEESEVVLDEGTVRLGEFEKLGGLYFLGGRYYPHFGELESWMVSDSLSQEIFELQESAVQTGLSNRWITTGLGVFEGDIGKKRDTRDRIDGLFADLQFHNPEDTWGGFSLTAGASYLNNVGDTDLLQGEEGLDGRPVIRRIGGVAGYFTLEYEAFGLTAGYISALEAFRPGELNFAVDRQGVGRGSRPRAWNFELAFRPTERLQLAGRFEGTEEMFGLLPRRQYGLAVSYSPFAGTLISGEYLRGEFDQDHQDEEGLTQKDLESLTLQFAVEF